MLSLPRLLSLNRPAPRYTSYPTAPEWDSIDELEYRNHLKELALSTDPLSIYVHIPFCHSICLFCGCSVILNRKPEKELQYVETLKQEIDLVRGVIGNKKRVVQLHFGGGTPTKLSEEMMKTLFETLSKAFEIDFSQEIAIEIDPRTVYQDQGKKLRFLRDLGFNRVSFGVQDTNPQVQEAIKRRQSYEMTRDTYLLARQLGFTGINLDFIYGLPYQTVDSFRKTLEDILTLRPDRIALFSYAKVPWLKPHQKAIPEETLPSTEEKFSIYALAREELIQAGYVGIGFDHFALADDELAISYREKRLQRNFQGYTVCHAENTLAFGVTAIGYVNQAYFQNCKDLTAYSQLISAQKIPITRGKLLSKDDQIRKWVIHTLMCDFCIDKREFEKKYQCPFDVYFYSILPQLHALEKDELIHLTTHMISATPLGELFVRNIAMLFDAYLPLEASYPKFSQSI